MINTKRLIITLADDGDATNIQASFRDPEISKYTATGLDKLDIDGVKQHVARLRSPASLDVGQWVIERLDNGAFVGTIVLKSPARGSEVTIGVMPGHRRGGYGSEAMYEFCTEMFRRGQFQELIGLVDLTNDPIKGLNQKIGMVQVPSPAGVTKLKYEAKPGSLINPNP